MDKGVFVMKFTMSKLSISVATTLIAFSVQADPPNLVWCGGCSDSQMQTAGLKTNVGTTYVADPNSGKINSYEVYMDTLDTQPPTHGKVADSVPTVSALVSDINSAVAYYKLPPVGWVKLIKSPASNAAGGSVYNIINAGPAQNRFVDDENSISSYWSDYHRAIGFAYSALAQFHVVDASVGAQETEEVDFSDGSRVDLKYDVGTNKMQIDPSTARDSHDNSVPYLGADGQIHNLGGDHEFDPNRGNPLDQKNFQNQLGKLGVQMIYAGSSASPRHGWACIQSGEGPDAVWTCQYY